MNRPQVLVPLLTALYTAPRELVKPLDMVKLPKTNLSTTVLAPTPLPRECNLLLRDTRLPPLVSDQPPRDQEHLSAVLEVLPKTIKSTTVPVHLPLPKELMPPREPKVPPREVNQPQLAVSELLPKDQEHPSAVLELLVRDKDVWAPQPRNKEHPSHALELHLRDQEAALDMLPSKLRTQVA